MHMLRRSGGYAGPMGAGLVVLVLLLALTTRAGAQSAYPPRSDPAVNDFAGVIAAADRAELQELRQALLDTRGVELVVATIDAVNSYDLPDQSLEAFATGLFNAWGIGDRTRNDGVLLLVAVHDRRVRIEMGSGYAAGYNDAMRQVIERDMLPHFRAGKLSQGIVAGARGIQTALASPPNVSVGTGLAGWLGLRGLAAAAAAALLVIAAVSFAARRRARSRSERCPACQATMRTVPVPETEQYLSAGQRTEMRLDAIRYTVWRCPRCGKTKAQATPRPTALTGCPKCNFHTFEHRSRTTKHATRHKTGVRIVDSRCHTCGHSTTQTLKIARLTAAPPASFYSGSSATPGSAETSGSSYDYGSSSTATDSSPSFDPGGSSSGDGASGSW